MAIIKKPNQYQDLIDKFNEEFGDYSIDVRGARYLAASLRLGDSGGFGVTHHFKIDVMKALTNHPEWYRPIRDDFRRYYNSKKLYDNNFDFIEESKYEIFFYEIYITNAIDHGFKTELPNSRDFPYSNFSNAKLIFGNLSLSNKEKMMFFYDAWSIEPSMKEIDLEKLKLHAYKFLELTSRCKWFDNEPNRLTAAHDHLKKFDANCGYFSDSDELRIYFYKTYGFNPEKVELSIRKIQMLFHNRKSRATKVKKQVNFSLSKKSIKNIKDLSLTHEENASKMVDTIFKNDELMRYIDKYLKKSKSTHYFENEISGI